MFNRNLDNITASFVRIEGGNFYCWFKGRMSVVSQKASSENCFCHWVGGIWSGGENLCDYHRQTIRRPDGENYFHHLFSDTTSHTYKLAERSFTAGLKFFPPPV